METITNIFSPFPLSVFNSNVVDQFDVQQFELSGNVKILDKLKSAAIGAFGQVPLKFKLLKFRKYFTKNYDDAAHLLYKKYLEVKLSQRQSKQAEEDKTTDPFYEAALHILNRPNRRCSPREFLFKFLSELNDVKSKHPGYSNELTPFIQEMAGLHNSLSLEHTKEMLDKKTKETILEEDESDES